MIAEFSSGNVRVILRHDAIPIEYIPMEYIEDNVMSTLNKLQDIFIFILYYIIYIIFTLFIFFIYIIYNYFYL